MYKVGKILVTIGAFINPSGLSSSFQAAVLDKITKVAISCCLHYAQKQSLMQPDACLRMAEL